MYSFRDEWIDNEEEYSMVLDKSYSTLIMYIKENNLYEHFSFVTDDTMADTFLYEGHLNSVVKKSLKCYHSYDRR